MAHDEPPHPKLSECKRCDKRHEFGHLDPDNLKWYCEDCWQEFSGKRRVCFLCRKWNDKGSVDRRDMRWYCDDCWDSYEKPQAPALPPVPEPERHSPKQFSPFDLLVPRRSRSRSPPRGPPGPDSGQGLLAPGSWSQDKNRGRSPPPDHRGYGAPPGGPPGPGPPGYPPAPGWSSYPGQPPVGPTHGPPQLHPSAGPPGPPPPGHPRPMGGPPPPGPMGGPPPPGASSTPPPGYFQSGPPPGAWGPPPPGPWGGPPPNHFGPPPQGHWPPPPPGKGGKSGKGPPIYDDFSSDDEYGKGKGKGKGGGKGKKQKEKREGDKVKRDNNKNKKKHNLALDGPDGEGPPADIPPDQITTLMIKGIPCSYQQESLVDFLKKVGHDGTYDFFYLPRAGHGKSNLGYAFVNFLTPGDAQACMQSMNGVSLNPERSQKVCSVVPAHIQGLESLKKHFRRTAVNRSSHGPMFPLGGGGKGNDQDDDDDDDDED